MTVHSRGKHREPFLFSTSVAGDDVNRYRKVVVRFTDHLIRKQVLDQVDPEDAYKSSDP